MTTRRTFLGALLAAPLLSPLRVFAGELPLDEVTVTFNDDPMLTITLRGYADGRIEGTYLGKPMVSRGRDGDWSQLMGCSQGNCHVAIKGKYVPKANNYALDGVTFMHQCD